jgi:hypothetical protein
LFARARRVQFASAATISALLACYLIVTSNVVAY